MNNEDKVRNLQRVLLDEALLKGIQRNEEQHKIWAAYKNGHLKVIEALNTFQKDLSVNCMVPIGKRALVKGKLIHTNEVLACLGDGYFAKYSATGAVTLCERRIQRADEMLRNLDTERDLYETRMMMLEGDVFEDCSGGEIVEHWNEEQIDEWKRKHREREREYHQKLAKLRQEEKKKIETEEDLFHRLDQLEIEEEIADELNRLEDEKYELFEEEFTEDESSESESSSETDKENLRNDEKRSTSEKKDSDEKVETCKIRKSVSFAQLEDNVNKEKVENSMKGEEASSKDEEEFKEDIIRIEFSHSNENPITKSEDNSIVSPADIYRIFSKPKSILKRSPNDIPEQVAPPEYSTEEEEEEDTFKPSTYETVVKDIKERDTTQSTNTASQTNEEKRPISRFKRERQSKQ